MRMSDEALKTILMQYFQHRTGKENATPREQVLRFIRVYDPDIDDRRLRKLYCSLPICSCENGLFLPKRPEEVEEFKAYLMKGWGPLLAERRVQIIFSFYPWLKNTQPDLFSGFNGLSDIQKTKKTS